MRASSWRLSLLATVFVSRVFASACVTDTLANYISLGVPGCTINGEIVNNFAFSVVTTSLGSPLTSGAITVTPSFSGGFFEVFFSATGGTPATGFTVSGSDFATYQINFTWDPVVVGAEDDMVANTPVFPGTATVTTKLCAGQLFGGVTCPTTSSPTNTLTVFSDGVPADAIPKDTTTFTTPVLIVDVINTIELKGNITGSSTITGFKTAVFTPEPSTWLSGAAGLLPLLVRRRRWRCS